MRLLKLGDLQRGGVQRIECECGWCRHDGSELEPLIEKAARELLKLFEIIEEVRE